MRYGFGSPALIQHVSDTALWIAAFRAEESRRSDAVFRDELAERLAGEKGRAMAAATPHRKPWRLRWLSELAPSIG
ncbi:MAG TPA: hypothetical protein VN616_00405 [Puia sp.]|nr:hypothetical protein [Puia sp.]